jgi:hypothetical protein
MGSFDTKKCLTCDRLRAEVEKLRKAAEEYLATYADTEINPTASDECRVTVMMREALAPPEEKS